MYSLLQILQVFHLRVPVPDRIIVLPNLQTCSIRETPTQQPNDAGHECLDVRHQQPKVIDATTSVEAVRGSSDNQTVSTSSIPLTVEGIEGNAISPELESEWVGHLG
jgi:hypothetical protein